MQDLSNDVKDLRRDVTFSSVDVSKLESDQLEIFNFFKKQVHALKSNKPVDKKLVIIQGKAGYGKSFTLKAMIGHCEEVLGKDSFVIVGPTGVSARNVFGETIHSFARLGRTSYLRDLSVDELALLRNKYKDLQIIFVDEYSLVGLRLLGMLEQRCREMKDCTDLFGGLCIYLTGDLYQLVPVGDKAIFNFQDSTLCSHYVERGKFVLGSFEKSFFLTKAKRFNNNEYVEFLERLSVGNCHINDLERVNERTVYCWNF